MLALLDDYLHAKNLAEFLIFSKNIDDQRILKSDWTRGTTGHIQQKVVVTDATFLSMAKNLRDQFIPSRDIDDQTILQPDWLSTF